VRVLWFLRAFSTPNPLRGSNSDLAQYSNTPRGPIRGRGRRRGRERSALWAL